MIIDLLCHSPHKAVSKDKEVKCVFLCLMTTAKGAQRRNERKSRKWKNELITLEHENVGRLCVTMRRTMPI